MTSRRFVDAVVTGAGPAGSSFAHVFARAGQRVLVVDRDGIGRSSVCGGFLGPETARSIRLAGLEHAFQRIKKNPIRQVLISAPGLPALQTALPAGSYAAERPALNAALADAAAEKGAQFAFQTVVLEAKSFSGMWNLTLAGPAGVSEVSARYWVRADGRRQPDAKTKDPVFFACKTLYERPADVADRVELHFVRRGHVGFNPIGGGKSMMCLHVDGRYLRESRGNLDAMMESLTKQNLELGEALRGVRRCEEWKSCPAQPDGRRIFYKKGVFFAGDAVTMVYPVVGGGVPLAIGSGAILAATLSKARGDAPEKMAARYQAAWEEEFGSRVQTAAWLGRAERSDTISGLVFKMLGFAPKFLPAIIERTRA